MRYSIYSINSEKSLYDSCLIWGYFHHKNGINTDKFNDAKNSGDAVSGKYKLITK